jgi:hypothetical protein
MVGANRQAERRQDVDAVIEWRMRGSFKGIVAKVDLPR